MPAINFPNSPAIGDTWPNPPQAGLPVYQWDGADWVSTFALGLPYVPIDGSAAMTGLLTLSGDPTAVLNATTKQYTDAADNALSSLLASNVAALIPRGYLWGLTMSTAGASTTLTMGAGAATDSTGVRIMKLAAALAKTTALWVAGAGGGLDTGAIAANTWYHWFLIANVTTNAIDVVFSATATPANGPTTMPSGYTLYRRIGSMKTNASSQWIFFHQLGDEFLWDAAITDVNAVATINGSGSVPLSVATGVQVNAIFSGRVDNVGGGCVSYFTSLDMTTVPVSGGGIAMLICSASVGSASGLFNVRTNISAQIRVTSNGTTATYSLVTIGWIDRRGRDA